MVAQTLKAKYHPKTSFLDANNTNKTGSYTWYSIQKAKWILKKGGLWNVGNGQNINIWTDCWLPRQQGYKIWTPKGEASQQWVKDLMVPETRWWNRQLINNLFLPFEAEQILQIPITNLARHDDFTGLKLWMGPIQSNQGIKLYKTGKVKAPIPLQATAIPLILYGRKSGTLKSHLNTLLSYGDYSKMPYLSTTTSTKEPLIAIPYAQGATKMLRTNLMFLVSVFGHSKLGLPHR
jgi:hypothetical protein